MLRVFKVSGRSQQTKNYILAKDRKSWFEAEQVLRKKVERLKLIGEDPFFVSPEGDIFLFLYIDKRTKKTVRLVADGVRQEDEILIFTTKEERK